METAEQTNKADWIRQLTASPGPCITIVLAGNEVGDTATELKDAGNTVRRELISRGIDPGPILDPVLDPAREFRGETRARGSIVILRSPSIMWIDRVRSISKPVVRVNDRFDLRTLLSIANDQKLFYVLALSQNRTRLVKCTQFSSEEIPFPAGTPASLGDSKQTRPPDHVLDNRSSAGPSVGTMKGVMFGTSSDREGKSEYIVQFFRAIDTAVNTILKGRTDPVIPLGVEHEIVLYRSINTYPGLLDRGIHGSPDGIEGGDLHRQALELLNGQAPEATNRVLADFDKKVGTGHASTHMQEIVAAAHEGRVSHFFFQDSAQYTGIFDPVRQRVKHTDDPLDSPLDLIETAALETITHGGEAKILPGSAMPNGVPACAIFRYPQ